MTVPDGALDWALMGRNWGTTQPDIHAMEPVKREPQLYAGLRLNAGVTYNNGEARIDGWQCNRCGAALFSPTGRDMHTKWHQENHG